MKHYHNLQRCQEKKKERKERICFYTDMCCLFIASNPCPCGHEGRKCGSMLLFTCGPLVSVGSIVVYLFVVLVLACGLIQQDCVGANILVVCFFQSCVSLSIMYASFGLPVQGMLGSIMESVGHNHKFKFQGLGLERELFNMLILTLLFDFMTLTYDPLPSFHFCRRNYIQFDNIEGLDQDEMILSFFQLLLWAQSMSFVWIVVTLFHQAELMSPSCCSKSKKRSMTQVAYFSYKDP